MAAGGSGPPAGGAERRGGRRPRRRRRPGAGAQVVITSVAGDTLETLSAPTTPGIHRVYWSFRGRPAPAPALSPSQKRDSIQNVRRTQAIFDSLAGTGMPKAILDRVQAEMLSGRGGGFRFGGGGGNPDYGEVAFRDRPSETPARPERRAGEPAPARAPGADMTEAEVRTEVFAAMRAANIGRGGGGGFRPGGGASMVNSGDYLVTLVVNGQPVGRQVLRVERVAGFDGEAITSLDDDDDREPDLHARSREAGTDKCGRARGAMRGDGSAGAHSHPRAISTPYSRPALPLPSSSRHTSSRSPGSRPPRTARASGRR